VRRLPPQAITQSLAAVLTAAVLLALTLADHLAPRHAASHPSIALTLEQAPPAPPTPQTEPKPTPPRPQPRLHSVAHPPTLQLPPMPPEPLSDAPLADAAVSVAAPPPPAPPAGGDHVSIEATYEARLRQIVDEHTSVPDNAEYRLVHPIGESKVSFRLDRRGALKDIALARSSGSRILDRRALEIVQTAQYPPFPDNAYPGESRHEFLITIEFRS